MIYNTEFIIPVYNEETRVKNLNHWIKWMKKNTRNSVLTLSLNGCTDNTEKILKSINNQNFQIIKTNNKGRGYAIINALIKSKKKFISIGSIDNAWDKNFYQNAYKKIINNENLFCVYGPKSHAKSKQNRILIRKIISLISVIFLKILFLGKIDQDTQCIKIFRYNNQFNKKLLAYNYFFDTHFFLLNKKMKLKYYNVAVRVNDNNKNSKVKFKSLFEFIYEAFKYLFKKN